MERDKKNTNSFISPPILDITGDFLYESGLTISAA